LYHNETFCVPIQNEGDVKIVVGKNLDQIVLDESKDALLEIYAPWCGHCQELEPTYNKLGKHLRGIDSLVIAKMDGTANEHPRAKVCSASCWFWQFHFTFL
jgi:protein disulfide-isomerase A1